MAFILQKIRRPAACLALTMLLLTGLAACGTDQNLSPRETAASRFAAWSDDVPEYRLGSGDTVQVSYLFTPNLDQEALVAPDGTITLRLAGRLQAEGQTVEQLNQAVTEASAKWMRQPVTRVAVREARSARIYVGGQVGRAGAIPLDRRIGALEAVLLAGGFTDEARTSEVVLIRRSPDDSPMLRTLDLQDFIQTGGADGTIPLAAGDILYVPRSGIAEVNLWIDQFINKVLPFQRSANFTYTVTRNGTGTGTVFP
ncbi:polysaccharide biosynthesis/export family protein [Oceanibaculum indicum]|uniref:Protein involved in polysaccharide export with SLBB domain n=1 Tax=Oceanibaculum indicum TaxID=526216 RepID=A0A420WAU8_9PROT|nr:polysaccharide biosynthesis/export family protein [Oceanibaculum indicum]RKQ68103.1 protein involved in polysaccharide export with SLBB domain [Oceanibaculum indicum]